MKRNNLYERNLSACMYAHYPERSKQFLRGGREILNKYFMHGIFLKYIEVLITTKCTLNCKECCNLIQYYQCPYHISAEDIVRDIRKLSRIAKEILQLRILGGEPLLHPKLAYIVRQILKLDNIKRIQIVTNGTLLFDEHTLKVLKNNPRISVDISNYGEKSLKRDELIEQLKRNHIKYYTQEDRIVWTKQADCTYRNRNYEQLKAVLARCHMDCISMLNGKIHLCPRSSHAMDLEIVPNRGADYFDLRQKRALKECKKSLYRLLNTTNILACNYCDVFRWERLPEVVAAEQISKEKANAIMKNFIVDRE